MLTILSAPLVALRGAPREPSVPEIKDFRRCRSVTETGTLVPNSSNCNGTCNVEDVQHYMFRYNQKCPTRRAAGGTKVLTVPLVKHSVTIYISKYF